ncbi:MAG TPA: hypothetical protein VFY36_05415 [Solirubrobacteraceae bacterium]|nr:hypothetical protein [Solirubrobacteraceae bacterium]
MPAQKPTLVELPSDELFMAAMERAECHRDSKDYPGVNLGTIKEHLGIPHNGWTTRQLRPKLEALEANGLIEPTRRLGIDALLLTDEGQARLDAARSEIGPLPEAPQHRAWAEARAAAGKHIAGFRADVRGTLDEAIELLEADREASSATWFEFSDRLRESCGRLATAIHCLREWPEPDDSKPDRDDEPPYNRRGRRSTRGWDTD